MSSHLTHRWRKQLLVFPDFSRLPRGMSLPLLTGSSSIIVHALEPPEELVKAQMPDPTPRLSGSVDLK